MKIELDITKNANENAQALFQKGKEAREKKENLLKEIEKTKKSIESEKNREKFQEKVKKQDDKRKVRILESREWFQKFHNFTTTDGNIVIAGRDAQQNDMLFAKYFEPQDLFFHADVHGASALIVKKGKTASEKSLKEAAQFAACYSSSWKGNLHVCDIFYTDKEHVEKYSHGEYVPKGGFMIRGEKKWFKNMELKLVIALERINNVEKLVVVPANYDFLHSPRAFIHKITIQPGEKEKKEVAKQIISILKADQIELALDQLMQMLPGNSEIV
jgi:predicted ribosome quality control (RQC) complex YloA/Tae2 family protein